MATDPRALVPTPLMKRLTQVVTYGLTGGWFSPERPLMPQQQQTEGRRFDYLAGYNISTRPRRDSGIDFQTLRSFSLYYDILRILIERRKDQIATFEWTIQPTNASRVAGEDIDQLTERAAAAMKFFKYPDGRNTWNTWLRGVIEDMLVLDAVALWPVFKGNQLQRLEWVDPATIKLIIDESGRRPVAPIPAYQQVLHGVPTSDYTQDELFYYISNPASNRVYGLSKVEQIMITIQIGLRRETSQLQFFTDGNVPAALAGVPDTWNSATIQQFQDAFDAMLQGDTGARRKIWFVPGEPVKNIKELKSEEALLKTPFDEWIIRIICFNLGISPTPFINQVNRATAFTSQEEARDEGLGPVLMFLKDMVDDVITKCLKLEGIEFVWALEAENDPSTQATIDDTLLKNGSRSIDELRTRDGLNPLGVGPMIYLPTGPVPVSMYADGTAPNLQPPEPKAGPGGAPSSGSPSNAPQKPSPARHAAQAASKPKITPTGKIKPSVNKPNAALEATKKEGSASSTPPFRRTPTFKKSQRYYHTVVPRRFTKSQSGQGGPA